MRAIEIVSESDKSDAILLGAYKSFFSTREGRKVLSNLYDFCMNSFGCCPDHINALSYFSGRHSVLLHIAELAGKDIRKYFISKHMENKVDRDVFENEVEELL